MAEDLDSDTCLGFKRRISQLSEIDSTPEQPANLYSLSPDQHSQSEIVSFGKEERETERNSPLFASESLNNSFLKKVKCCTSPGDPLVAKIVDVQEKQETEEEEDKKLGLGNDVVVKMKSESESDSDEEERDGVVGGKSCGSQLVTEKGKELKNREVGGTGFHGNHQEFGEVKKNSCRSSRLSVAVSVKEVPQMHMQSPGEQLWNTGSATSCVNFDEENESIIASLKNKGENEPAVESITSIAINNIDEEFDNFSWVDNDDGKLGTVEFPPDIDEKFSSVCKEEGVLDKMVESSDGEKKVDDDGPTGNGETTRCSLKIEVIDETAVIETTSSSSSSSSVATGIGKEKGFVGYAAKHSETYAHKNFMKQETYGKKEKRPRRRGKDAKKLSGTNGKEKILTTHMAEAQIICKNKGDETKRAYLREEMESLRFVHFEAQREKWTEVYCGLAPSVAREYDGLIDCNHQKHINFNFDPRRQFGKKEKIPGVLGEDYFQAMDNAIENMNPLDPACGLRVSGDYTVVEGECSEEDDSDDDYSSIQRPAFVVTGEPNFDSGPPQDGLEYLRRVRWEAAQIPKVKVAKLERSKLNKEQTVYMPKIPDIAKCPEHLLPLKQWEDAFIADFSELRLTLSCLEGCSAKFQFSLSVHEEESSNQIPESIIVEKFDNLTTDGVESYEALDCSMPENSCDPRSFSTVDEKNPSPSLENSNSKSFAIGGGSSNSPTLSAILKMDSVARLSMLRKRISLVENMSTLSRNDCAWFFALCAAIDTPLDADTCAALRCLLRKSASLRAEKSQLDDEVVLLNILATITGKYFGQSE